MQQTGFTEREVSKVLKKFSNFAADAENSDWQSWVENLRQFVHFCNNEPILGHVVGLLKKPPLVDFARWKDTVLHVQRKKRSDGLFPTDEDEKLSLFYQIICEINDDTDPLNFMVNFLHQLLGVGGFRDAVGGIQSFNNTIFSKFVRLVEERLEEYVNEVSESSQQGAGFIINTGTFINGSVTATQSQIGIGDSTTIR